MTLQQQEMQLVRAAIPKQLFKWVEQLNTGSLHKKSVEVVVQMQLQAYFERFNFIGAICQFKSKNHDFSEEFKGIKIQQEFMVKLQSIQTNLRLHYGIVVSVGDLIGSITYLCYGSQLDEWLAKEGITKRISLVISFTSKFEELGLPNVDWLRLVAIQVWCEKRVRNEELEKLVLDGRVEVALRNNASAKYVKSLTGKGERKLFLMNFYKFKKELEDYAPSLLIHILELKPNYI